MVDVLHNVSYNGPSWAQLNTATGSKYMLAVLTAPGQPILIGAVARLSDFSRGYFQVDIRRLDGTLVSWSGNAPSGGIEATYRAYRS